MIAKSICLRWHHPSGCRLDVVDICVSHIITVVTMKCNSGMHDTRFQQTKEKKRKEEEEQQQLYHRFDGNVIRIVRLNKNMHTHMHKITQRIDEYIQMYSFNGFCECLHCTFGIGYGHTITALVQVAIMMQISGLFSCLCVSLCAWKWANITLMCWIIIPICILLDWAMNLNMV